MITWQETEHPCAPRGACTGGRFTPTGTRRLVIPRPRTEQARVEAVLREHRGFVYSRVKYYHRAYGTLLSLAEYESAAVLGAIQAATQYDARKGSFPNWAIRYIDGAIKAELREVLAGVVHIPRDALWAEGHPTYTDLDTARVVAPDALHAALEKAEEAVAMQTAKSHG